MFTATPINQNARLKSFTAPFFAMFDLNLEQPIFGANYIKGKVRSDSNEPPFAFKLKFNKGAVSLVVVKSLCAIMCARTNLWIMS